MNTHNEHLNEHLGEAIQDFLDGRLGEAECAQAQTHLQACAQCRGELDQLRQVKAAVATQAARQEVPVGLRDAITHALDQEDLRVRANAPTRQAVMWLRRRWALGFGLAATAAFVSVLLWFAQAPAGLPAAVAQDFAEFQAGGLPLDLRTAEPRALERFFASRGIEFETRVFDLGMMNYRVVGGRIHKLQGRPSALFVYQGPGDARLLCQMYEGRLDELPPATETLEHNGVAFRVYRQDGLTAVFWPEGKVICVLVSDLDPGEVIRLAFAKAVRVAV